MISTASRDAILFVQPVGHENNLYPHLLLLASMSNADLRKRHFKDLPLVPAISFITRDYVTIYPSRTMHISDHCPIFSLHDTFLPSFDYYSQVSWHGVSQQRLMDKRGNARSSAGLTPDFRHLLL